MNSTNSDEIIIALAGNPNSGKTTVFNALTGSRQHVANWPGVTVERKEGVITRNGVTFRIVDLPGIYSLSAYSQEEIVARDFLIHNKVDVIVNVVDASNLERNLYLTTQLLELGKGTIVALNMVDMAKRMGINIDIDKFAKLLGVEVVPTVASKGEGIDLLLDKALEVASRKGQAPPRMAKQSSEVEIEVEKLEQKLKVRPDCHAPVRWLIIKALEGDPEARAHLAQSVTSEHDALSEIDSIRRHLEHHYGDDIEAVIADGRYGFVGGLLRETVTRTVCVDRFCITDKIDNVLLNRVLGIPIFLGLMWLTFKLTFDVGGYFAEWIKLGVAALSSNVQAALPPGPLSSLIVNGIIEGVGSVIQFLPIIMVMFTIISFLDDSGYMARAAFLMDRTMHLLGLHGKSFIPMLMGFGCNVPAIMAARTLNTREDRILTILITPFMSCTARLPIYALFASVFFSKSGAWVIFSIYALGILLAVLSGKLLRKVLIRKDPSPFVMELPPYRLPTFKGTLLHVWERSSVFLTKAGTIILAASVVIWAFGYLPAGVEFGSESSIIGKIGKILEPAFKPLGLGWQAAVALLLGIGAKEIVVSTLGVLFGIDEKGNPAVMQAFTPLTAYVFMIMSLIYLPCVATIAAIKRETGSWKWTIFSMAYSLTLAYAVALLFYRTGLLMGFK